jgi:YVTN family beta-propeller protein
MKTAKITCLFLALATIISFNSCSRDEDNNPKGAFSNGMFIVNEGLFQNGTGTITYFNSDSNLVKQDIFELVNGKPLGNIAQSMTIFNGKGYIVVNNSGKVEVVDAASFKSLATITNLINPSQFLVVSDKKAYVSDWVGHIAVVDIEANAVTKTIPAGTGPDEMIKSGNYVYVANTGGFGIDSTITVIDFATDKVVKNIRVGDAPAGLVADGNGRIWVICKGKGFNNYPLPGDTPGRLVRIDPASLTVDQTYNFTSSDVHPEKLVINKQKSLLYFLFNNGIYRFDITSGTAVPEKLISRSFYSLGYENKSGYLYAADAKNYTGNGIVLRFRTSDGSVVDSVNTGIVPRDFAFPGQE